MSKTTFRCTEEFKEKFKNFPEQFVSNLEARGYLAAAIDGEGHVYPRVGYYRVTITNTDENFLLTCIECLEKHGIHGWYVYRVRRREYNPNHNDFYQLIVANHPELLKLKRLPLKVQKKKEALESICQRTPRQKKNPKTLEKFAKLYNNGVKHVELMNLFGISPSTVVNWIQLLDEEGKITRERAGNNSIPTRIKKRLVKQANQPSQEELNFRKEEIIAEAMDISLTEEDDETNYNS